MSQVHPVVVKMLLNTTVLGVFMLLYVVDIHLVYRVEMRTKGEIVQLWYERVECCDSYPQL